MFMGDFWYILDDSAFYGFFFGILWATLTFS